MVIRISPPDLTKSHQSLRISWKVSGDSADVRSLYFEVDTKFQDFVDDCCDAALIGLLAPAILGGHDLHVEGPMSGKLYYQVSQQAIPLLTEFFAAKRKITLSAPKIVECQPTGTAVMTGFSAGVDSFCTLHDHSPGQVPNGFEVTHLAYNNVGAHGRRDEGERVFRNGVSRTMEFAKEAGYPLIAVNSNLDDFYDGNFQATHTLRNATVALLLQRGVRRFLYSSAYPYRETTVRLSYDIAYIDPVLLPLLGTERVECLLSGGRWSRVNKTRRVVALDMSRKYLDVCTRPHLAPKGMPNCGICWKCVRTEMTLEILGQLEAYAGVFPLSEYRRFRKLYLMEVMASSDPLIREVCELLTSKGFKVGWRIRLIAHLLPSRVANKISRSFPFIRQNRRLIRLLSAAI